MFGWYDRYVLPRAVEHLCGARSIERQRRKVIPRAAGEVLEVGVGTGFNLRWYDPEKVTRVVGLDPSDHHTRRAREAVAGAPVAVELVSQRGQDLPFDAHRFDSVVVTYTLCSIGPVSEALREMRRVLRPGGRLFFIEHGLAPDPATRRWQDRLTPLWKRLGGGCHLNRDVPALLEAAGFAIADLETLYLPGPRWLNYNYWGSATPAR